MRPTVKLTKKSNLPSVERQLKQIAASEVYVGIPESNNDRPGEEIGNASLLYLATVGSPLNHTPSRPVLDPAITQPRTKELIGKQLGGAASDLLARNATGAREHLEKAGIIAANAAKRYVLEGDNLAPNAPSTIARKKSDRPLVEKNEMVAAITWLVKT